MPNESLEVTLARLETKMDTVIQQGEDSRAWLLSLTRRQTASERFQSNVVGAVKAGGAVVLIASAVAGIIAAM